MQRKNELNDKKVRTEWIVSTEARVGVDGGARKLAHQSQIGTLSQLLAGGVADALSETCTAPLARLTILFQKMS
ncbi:hypothetical protein ACB092_09G040100 [Castanea dentata]